MKSATMLLALALLISASLACGGGTAVPTPLAPATNPPTSVATLAPPQPTNPPSATSTLGPASVAPTVTPASSLPENGTPEEAKAMLQKAVEHYNSVGREQALADFTGKVAPFVDRDLYVVCIDSKHMIVANGGFPEFVGTSADVILTFDHMPLGKFIWQAVAGNNEGSVRYIHINPVSGKIELKLLFFQKVAPDLICGVGAYNPQ